MECSCEVDTTYNDRLGEQIVALFVADNKYVCILIILELYFGDQL